VASPGSGVPFGSTQKLSQARPTSTTSAAVGISEVESRRRNTTPPAEKARTIRGLDMSPMPACARLPRRRPRGAPPHDAPSRMLRKTRRKSTKKQVCLDGHDAAFVAIHAENLEQVLFGVEIVWIALDELADDGDGMKLEHLYDELSGELGVVVVHQGDDGG